ncbi:MAG: WG repeat-containing protein [Ruminococcus sp.]|nr:WG repeat-containing protein [Ruminococcus sp.]
MRRCGFLNKQTRFIVSALFIVIIMLAIAIRKFYSDTTPSTGNNTFQTDIINSIDTDDSGNRIFKDNSGLSGIIDGSDRIIVAPEWHELKFTDNNICIARQRINEKLMTGCIDYEGNVIVPLIYNDIEHNEEDGFEFYTATSGDNSCVIYDGRFVPCFRRSWKSYNLSDNEITLKTDRATYEYAINKDGFRLKSAEIVGKTLDRSYVLSINSRILLSKLSVSMLEKMTEITGKYIEYAYTGNDDILENISNGKRSGFTQMFPEDHKILSKKLLNISEIFMYSVRSDDDIPHYAVSVTADTEIEYSDEKSGKNILRDEYTAVVEFSGYSENNLTAISGKFTQDKPEYPQPEETEDTSENEEHEET